MQQSGWVIELGSPEETPNPVWAQSREIDSRGSSLSLEGRRRNNQADNGYMHGWGWGLEVEGIVGKNTEYIQIPGSKGNSRTVMSYVAYPQDAREGVGVGLQAWEVGTARSCLESSCF